MDKKEKNRIRIYKWRKDNPERWKEIQIKARKKFFSKNPIYLEKYKEAKRKSDRKYQRNKRSRIKGYKTEEYRIYREKYPEKVSAQQKLNQALKKNKLTRSPVCDDCGIKTKTHGHHPNYSKPLEVIWLCGICHKKAHK